ncbi:MAG: hypothetical protein ABR540_12195, partial [Acidimicrobiales bacterium]
RLAHQDVVGNYLSFRFGRRARIFVDDRVDMYPVRIPKDYISLLRGRPGSQEILDRYRVDVVLWQTDRPLAHVLELNANWRTVYRDDDGWVVFRRNP